MCRASTYRHPSPSATAGSGGMVGMAAPNPFPPETTVAEAGEFGLI